MTVYGLRILQHVGIRGAGHHDPLPEAGAWVRTYSPEAHGGLGDVTWTEDPDEARAFNTTAEALAYWRQIPDNRPLRQDGAPNRPLTAFSIAIQPIHPKEGTP